MRIVATNMFYNFTGVIHRGVFYSHVQVFDGFWEGDIGDDQKYSSGTRGAEKYPYHHGELIQQITQPDIKKYLYLSIYLWTS